MRRVHVLAAMTAAAAAAALLAAPAASAQSVAICHDGGPGSTRQAAEAVEQFLRHVERVAGLTAGSLSGEYHTTRKACATYVASAHPAVALLDTGTYLAHVRPWRLEPVAHMGAADAVRYHVLVREGSSSDLASLQGKRVAAAVPDDSRFLAGIAVGGDKGSPTTWDTRFVRGALKALRQVAREEAEAAVVDNDAYAHLADLDLPKKLTSIHRSDPVPGLTMFAVGANAETSADVVDRIKAALPKLCAAEGAKLCKTFDVKGFTPAEPAIYDALRQRYGK